VAGRDASNMIGPPANVPGDAGTDIAQGHDASRGGNACSRVGFEAPVPAAVARHGGAAGGILPVRIV
jgi:hypothetical protein